MTTAEDVQHALQQRKAFILDNSETITLKKLREVIAEDMGLISDDLKPFKKTIGAYVDVLMASPAEPAAQEEEEQVDDSEDEAGSDSDDGEEKKKKSTATAKKRKSTEAVVKAKSAPRVFTKKVERMRTLCRQATITIAPNIYSKFKSDAELEAAFVALLSKNGLSPNASPTDVATVKHQLQLQRELEGIDTSNIISEGRRNRSRPATNYRAMLQASSDSEEDEEMETAAKQQEESDDDDDDDDESGNSDNDGDVEKEAEEEEAPAENPSDTDAVKMTQEPVPEQGNEDQQELVKKIASPVKKMAVNDAVVDGENSNGNVVAKKARVLDWSDDDDA